MADRRVDPDDLERPVSKPGFQLSRSLYSYKSNISQNDGATAGRQRSLTISSVVCMDAMHQRDRRKDGQTDGHRATAKIALTHSAVKTISQRRTVNKSFFFAQVRHATCRRQLSLL